MPPHFKGNLPKNLIQAAAVAVLMILIRTVTRSSGLIFYTIAETVAAALLWSVFILAVSTRRIQKTGYFIFLGTGLLFAGLIGLCHLSAYQGTDPLPGSTDENTLAQLRIALRFVLGVSFVCAPLFLQKKPGILPVLAGFSAGTALLLFTILGNPVFPDCFTPTGPSAFQKSSESAICILLLTALWMLRRNRAVFDSGALFLLSGSIVLSVFSGLSFIVARDPSGVFNAAGHILQVLAFAAVCKAMIEAGVTHPMEIMSRDLKQKETERFELQETAGRMKSLQQAARTAATTSAALSAINTVNAMTEGVVLIKLNGTVLNANPSALTMTGFQLQDVLGKNLRALLPLILDGEGRAMMENTLDDVAKKQHLHLRTLRIRPLQGSPRTISPSIAYVASSRDLPETAVLTLKDITKLHENTEILERVFNNNHISIVYMDRQFNIARVNRTYAAACGRPIEFFPGKNHFDLYPHEETRQIFQQVVDSGESFTDHDKPFQFPDHPDWGVSYWNWSLQPIKDEQGRVEALIFCLMDTTSSNTARLALEQSEQKYRELVENANSIIMRITPDHRITFFNEYAQRFFGFTANEVLGKNIIGTITPPIDSAGNDLRQMVAKISARPEHYVTNENENVCKDGRRVWINWTNKVICDEQGNLLEILCVGTDATARRQVQQENLLYQERLRRLAEQLAVSEEQERWEISRYIHDTIVQNLSLSSMKLASLHKSPAGPDSAPAASTLEITRDLIDDAIAECRVVMSELTPPLLYELGLVSALHELADHLSAQHGISIAVHTGGDLGVIDNARRGLLFQSTRELVMNALKHARCAGIRIALSRSGETVRVSVRDDGCGFSPAAVRRHESTAGGFGLFSIGERLENLNGQLDLQSAPDYGTEATLSLPCPAAEL